MNAAPATRTPERRQLERARVIAIPLIEENVSCCLWVRRVPGEGRAKPLGALSRFVRPPSSGADWRMLAQRGVAGNC